MNIVTQPAADERQQFSDRLMQAMKTAHYADSPTTLSREFNARWPGSPVTVHAVRKWMVGESIPTQDKLRVLADMLGVSIDWLRFGTGDDRRQSQMPTASHELKLLADLKRLDERAQAVVRDLIRSFMRQQA